MSRQETVLGDEPSHLRGRPIAGILVVGLSVPVTEACTA